MRAELSANDDPSETIVTRLDIRQAFQTLPEASREILFLIDVMGMRYSEAADILGIPNGTVMSRVSRARKALLDQMGATDDCVMKARDTGTRDKGDAR